MNRQQAIHVLELIRDLYPRYNISKEKAIMLVPTLLPMDYERVRENLKAYVAAHPYAPTIAVYDHLNVPLTPLFLPASDKEFTTLCQTVYQEVKIHVMTKWLAVL